MEVLQADLETGFSSSSRMGCQMRWIRPILDRLCGQADPSVRCGGECYTDLRRSFRLRAKSCIDFRRSWLLECRERWVSEPITAI